MQCDVNYNLSFHGKRKKRKKIEYAHRAITRCRFAIGSIRIFANAAESTPENTLANTWDIFRHSLRKKNDAVKLKTLLSAVSL